MDLELRARVYLVTGGARGLGRATAECLVADGANVVLSGHRRHVAAFLMSQAASFVSGTVVAVDGGMLRAL